MNEGFLSQFRKEPRPEFRRALYDGLVCDEQARMSHSRPVLRRLAFALAGLILAFGMALAVSPAVRAQVSGLLAKITVHGITIFVDEPRSISSGEGETYSEVWTPVTPEQINNEHPFFAIYPAWMPLGYSLQTEAALYYVTTWAEVPDSALVQWKNLWGDRIQLHIASGSCPNGPPEETTEAMGGDCTLLSYFSVGLESQPQVVKVHGDPAVMFHGIMMFADLFETDLKWNVSRWQWNNDPEAGYSLFWEKKGRAYSLVAWGKTISEKDMIRIAESIP